jgi:hypothetical protein
MQVKVHRLCCWIVPILVIFAAGQAAMGQNPPETSPAVSTALPDAPVPAGAITQNPAQQPAPSQQPQPPAQQQTPDQAPPPAQGQQSSSSAAQQPKPEKSQREKAEEQIREQEHQRVAGIVPSFNVTYRSDAVSLTPAQKFKLQFRSAIDPYTFAIAMIVAGLGEAEDTNSGFGWGPEGYTKRAAAEYADNVIGNTLGNALLPSILHQDPRYFRMGHGSPMRRALYAAATTWICKHDNTGKWEPNYSNVLGNMIAGEISNLYYPEQKGKNDTVEAVENGLTVTFEGSFGGELQEFWPDISRKLFHKDPTHGLDAQARARDAAAKEKKQQEQSQQHQQ